MTNSTIKPSRDLVDAAAAIVAEFSSHEQERGEPVPEVFKSPMTGKQENNMSGITVKLLNDLRAALNPTAEAASHEQSSSVEGLSWAPVKAGDSIKEYLKVEYAGTGDYEFTVTCDGLIAHIPGVGLEFRPNKETFVRGETFIFDGKNQCDGWVFTGVICTRFSNGDPIGGALLRGSVTVDKGAIRSEASPINRESDIYKAEWWKS